MNEIVMHLFELQDLKYRDFHSKLMPAVNKERVIGVRVPELRKYAKELSRLQAGKQFLKELPHKYYEEDNIHAFIIEEIKDFDIALVETQKFLPYIDNWATCDMFMPKVFKKEPLKLLPEIYKWINSDKTYTVRYGIGILMKLFLDDYFDSSYLKIVSEIKSDEYYVNMMIAWYFATALDKQYDETITYITDYRLGKWVHNKTIQKVVESNRIDKGTKVFLKHYKIC